MERGALVLLCGLAALLRVGDRVNCRDDVEAMELVWDSIEKYGGYIKANPSALRQYRARFAELQAEATTTVNTHWAEIERTANALQTTQSAKDLAATDDEP